MAFEAIPTRPSIKPPVSATIGAPAESPAELPAGQSAIKEDTSAHALGSIAALLNDIAARQRTIERRIDTQSAVRPKRQEMRKRTAPAMVLGRNGELLSRRHDDSINPFELPEEFVEITRAEDYDLEWKAEMVQGQDRLTQVAKLQANGWRPVPNKRLPGMFAPEGDEGSVRHDGMLLMERPLSLTMEARREEERKATEQVRMKHESWGINSKNTEIFDPNTPMARSFTIQPRSTVEASDPAWQPALEISSDDA